MYRRSVSIDRAKEMQKPKMFPLRIFPTNIIAIELATKRLRILSIDGNDKIRNRLVANSIHYPDFYARIINLKA